jgi:hypothetical protein
MMQRAALITAAVLGPLAGDALESGSPAPELAVAAPADLLGFIDALSAAYDNLMPRRTATGAWRVGRRRYSSFNLALWAAGEDPKYSALTYGDGPFPPRRKRRRAGRR